MFGDQCRLLKTISNAHLGYMKTVLNCRFVALLSVKREPNQWYDIDIFDVLFNCSSNQSCRMDLLVTLSTKI